MKLLAAIATVAFLAAGCSATAPWHSGWSKPGMTGEVFEQDVRACDREAMRLAAGQPGHQGSAMAGARTVNPTQPTLRAAEHKKPYVECMKNKGYTPTKDS